MKNSNSYLVLTVGLLVVVITAMVTSSLSGTATPRVDHEHPTPVAVIDLSHLFKNYARFTDLTADLKTDAMTAQAELKLRAEQIQEQAKKLKELERGSPEFSITEMELARTKTNLDLDVKIMRKKLAQRESKVYFDVYEEVKEAISNYAKARNISVVFRYNGTPIDPNNITQVQQGLTRTVIYQDEVDITEPILQLLQKRYAKDIENRKDKTVD